MENLKEEKGAKRKQNLKGSANSDPFKSASSSKIEKIDKVKTHVGDKITKIPKFDGILKLAVTAT
jgi:hypothetical protein